MTEQKNNPPKRPSFHPKPDNNNNNKKKFNFYWIYGAIAVIFIALQFLGTGSSLENIQWQKFEKDILAKHEVDKIVVVNQDFAEIYIKKEFLSEEQHKKVRKKSYGDGLNPGPHYKLDFVTYEDFKEELKAAQARIIAQDTIGKSIIEKQDIFDQNRIVIAPETRKDWSTDILSWIFPILMLVALYFIFTRMMNKGGGGGQIFNIGKSKAQLFDKGTSVSINFNDVAGLEEAKVEVMEIVDFLKNPKKYTTLGGKIPKGALLVGPPGTGKTLLAKAVAGEAKVPFFSISGSDFVEMFVGVGASRVRDLFRTAKEKAPCIVFIDEIDAIGRARGKNAMTGANDERENTLNQLLTEMDGFATNAGVIILAATNRADILDRALMRAGRFDRQIHVELPDLTERRAIFGVHIKPLKYYKGLDVDFLAKQTPGFSGADIANVCNESALIAARQGHKTIMKQDFLDAIDRIVGGLEKRSKIISLDEKKVIAYHEAGHASTSWLLQYANPLVKVTIIPRGKALGAAWYLPEERQITTFEQMFDEMCALLGGRASEEINFGKVSTGALNDLERVTKQAYAMVTYFGLNKEIGNISYYDSSGQSEYSFHKPYSEKTAETIDKEISKLVESAYQRSLKLLRDNKEKVDKLAHYLLEKEVIFREDVEDIFGKREWNDHTEMESIKPIIKANKAPKKTPKKTPKKAAIKKKTETEVKTKIEGSTEK
ncbi:MAG: ATP-dependent zinc metalloprotease FtsH [Saprospiraceae bacterium]|nr:ATP-dependent zinc metalloprotease FtsH [Saprospiraceae bacterium]